MIIVLCRIGRCQSFNRSLCWLIVVNVEIMTFAGGPYELIVFLAHKSRKKQNVFKIKHKFTIGSL